MTGLAKRNISSSPLGTVSTLTSLRVLQVVSHLDSRRGGISAAVPRLAAELSRRHGIPAELCLFGAPGELDGTLSEEGVRSPVWPTSRLQWLREPSLRKSFSTLIGAEDVVHIHGLWETSVTAASWTAKAARVPYIISAHGMLEAWALANKALKKRIYSALLERTNLQDATCLHALTGAEAEDYRRYGCKQPIAVIPNGIDSPGSANPESFLRRFPAVFGKSVVLFLGRIHFKKGFDVLIPAWAAIAQRFPNAVLVLAGPNSENSEAAVRRSIEQFGIADRTIFTGMLDAELKWSALAAATCFVLPSHSEGLSVAVLEALSMGVPVIVSEQCHFPEVARSQAGWVIKTEVQALKQALIEVLESSEAQNAMIGQRGKVLSEAYRWETVSARLAELYRCMADGRTWIEEVWDGGERCD